MKNKPIKFSGHSLDTGSVATERKESTKTWLAIVATAALALGMFFVQSCSNSLKAGPNGGDIVTLNDGKTSAEVVANAESGEVMVHTWDHDLKQSRPLEARPLTLGAAQNQIQLDPRPSHSDPPGYCSRFYGRGDWIKGGNFRQGWLGHSDTPAGRSNFEWQHGWEAGRNHGHMWSEMSAQGSGMGHGSSGMGSGSQGGMRHQ